MQLDRLLETIERAITEPPIEAIRAFCEPFYSPYYNLLYFLAQDVGLGICVELGVETGRGSHAMLQGGAIVFGVENNADRKGTLHSWPWYYLTIGSSLPPPEIIVGQEKKIALLHIDTEHSFAQAREEFNAYRPFLQDGAVVLFDDTNAMEGEVRKFVESLPYEKFFDDRLHPSCGFGGIIYREQA